MSKLSIAELKKNIRNMSWNELEDMLCSLYKKSNQANVYFNARFNAEGYSAELVDSYKVKIDRCFPWTFTGQLKLSDAKNFMNELIKLTNKPSLFLDLMLYYVECGNAFTQEVGDIDAPFYNSLLSMFSRFAEELNAQEDDRIYLTLKERIDVLLSRSGGIGWGYSDGIEEIESSIIWRDEE